MKSWQKILLGIVAIGLVAGAGYFGFQTQNPVETTEVDETPETIAVSTGDVTNSIIAPGELVNFNTVNILTEVDGIISEINVRPGDAVEEGDLIARLGNVALLESRLATARIAHTNAEAALNSLYTNAEANLAQEWLNLLDVESQYYSALGFLRYLHNYSDDEEVREDEDYEGPEDEPTALEFERGEARLLIAENNLTQAQAYYDSLVDGIDPAELTRAEADLIDAEINLQTAEEEIAGTEVYAPFDGVVLEVNANVGEHIGKGQNLIRLLDPLALEVVVSVVEEDYPLIEVGQQVELYTDALPELSLLGRVDRIVPERVSGDRPLYRVYISMDEVPEGLAEGMTVDTNIIIEQRTDVLILPRALVRASSDGTATVHVWVNGHVEERSLLVGLRGNINVEILDGVALGDLVVSQ